MAFTGWGHVDTAQFGGRSVNVVANAPGNLTEKMKTSVTTKDGQAFHAIRLVVNLILTQEANTTNRLDLPIDIQVNLTDGDIKAAGGINKIKVAYWRNGWVDVPVKSRGGNLVTVSYDKNGDPPIAVGT